MSARSQHLLTATMVAKRIGRSKDAVIKAADTGHIKPIMFPDDRRFYFDEADVDRWIARRKVGRRVLRRPAGYLNATELARLAKVVPSAIRGAIRLGRIKAVRFNGGRPWITDVECARYLADRMSAPRKKK